MRLARRISQIIFFLFFLLLFFQASYPYQNIFLPSDLFLQASPLVGLTTFLSTWSLGNALILGFVLLILSIVLGRFFCGWICPLGTTIDFSDKVFFRKRKSTVELPNYRAWKFILLVVLLVAALFSVQIAWLFDPIVIFFRFFSIVFYPAFVFLVYGFFDAAFNVGLFEDQLYSLHHFAQQTILTIEQPPMINGLPILILFLAILALGFLSRRFWCRALCPLGALFGLFSRFRLLKRRVDTLCTSCGLCARRCRMHAIADDCASTNQLECIACGECVSDCPENSISYRFGVTQKHSANRTDMTRRHLILAGLSGIAGAALFKVARGTTRKNAIIRPPGAIEEEMFLATCIRCQACTHICASTGGCLQPSLTESGLQGVWSPAVMPRIVYCEYNCTLCGQVCPTSAIQKLPLADKQKLVIGRAIFNKDTCIPWREHTNCLVCEEHCPLPDKAIKFDVRKVQDSHGEIKAVKFPYVVPELCIGCGICENKCPVVGQPGIFVTPEHNQRVKLST